MNILKKSALILSVMFLTGCAEALEQMGFSEVTLENSTVIISNTESAESLTETTTTTDFSEKETEPQTEAISTEKPEIKNLYANMPDLYGSELYNGMLESLENMEMYSEYDTTIEIEDVDKVIDILRVTNPEYFWVKGATLTQTYTGTSKIQIKVIDGYSTQELESMLSELEKAADNLISQIPHEADDYGKALFVHDYIINNTKYDSVGAMSDEKGLYNTAYGCLVQGNAVCQGYAEAFQYIMNRLGIECGICSGETSQGRHAWNYINIYGKYYWIDVTWDDPVSSTDNLVHTYFLVDDERILRTRYLDDEQVFVPSCFSMDNNYFVHNNTYVSYYSDDKLSQIFNDYADSDKVEIMFSDEYVYNESLEKLFYNGGIWDFVSGNNINYSNDDAMYVITVNLN